MAAAQADHRLAAVAWAATWTAMFATSAGYHRLAHSVVARRRMRRADHSMIFLHMGGATTALSLLCLPAPAGRWCCWSPCVRRRRRDRPQGDEAAVEAPLGRVVALRRAAGHAWPALPAFAATMSLGQLALLVASGALYAVGGVLFFQKRPDPLPRVFGYHEVWHCFTVAGGLCQYVLMHQLVG